MRAARSLVGVLLGCLAVLTLPGVSRDPAGQGQGEGTRGAEEAHRGDREVGLEDDVFPEEGAAALAPSP